MNLPHIPSEPEPLTLRQHEQYVRETQPRLEGETDGAYKERLEKRLIRLREDFDRRDKRGTLYLMNADDHRARTVELEAFASDETDYEKRTCLSQAAHIHLHHARRLDAEAAEKEHDAV